MPCTVFLSPNCGLLYGTGLMTSKTILLSNALDLELLMPSCASSILRHLRSRCFFIKSSYLRYQLGCVSRGERCPQSGPPCYCGQAWTFHSFSCTKRKGTLVYASSTSSIFEAGFTPLRVCVYHSFTKRRLRSDHAAVRDLRVLTVA